jgi:von Willebrand factor type A domain
VLFRISLILLLLYGVTAATPQRRPRRGTRPAPAPAQPAPPVPEPTVEPTPETSPEVDDTYQQTTETLKINTNLVTVPVIATTVEGNYVPDLTQDEFSITEDGEKQQIAFFASVSAPFNVVLLLDTSASTEDKLGYIRKAASAFVEQLQSADRVKVISFDNEVRELIDFTNDRVALRNAIYKTNPGTGTKVYDAFELALASLRPIKGRRAIVMFSDGVDWHSDSATFDGSLHGLDEEGIIVYPIRYETRAEAERIVREANDTPSLPTIGVIQRPPSGTTAPTFPGDDTSNIPTTESTRKGPFGLPTAEEILRGSRRRPTERPTDRPSTDRLPGPTDNPSNDPGGRRREGDREPPSSTNRDRRMDDSIGHMLDGLYLKADSYLIELAKKSGGRIVRADTINSLPAAFAQIAAELRTQYAIGYYPVNKTRDGQYRKIKVGSNRKNVVLRARPGYRAPSGG